MFAILARKAKRVAKHPSLEGWIFTTTRLESATASRRRGQHQRRIEALKSETRPAEEMDPEDLESWRDALPHLNQSIDRLGDNERDILLARFFTGSSFKEIAERFGKSEAACKMRVKRSLEKLNGWMTKRGATSPPPRSPPDSRQSGRRARHRHPGLRRSQPRRLRAHPESPDSKS